MARPPGAEDAPPWSTFGSAVTRGPKIASRLAHQLIDDILGSELDEGSPLPPEREMAAAFGVGRTTVREALRILESLGAISIRAGRGGGPTVRRPRPRDLSGPLTLMFQFEQATMLDVLQARQVLEPSLSRLAAERATAEQIEAMRDTVALIRDDPEDDQRYLVQNERFHNLVGAASGSPVLRLYSDSLQAIADGGLVGFRYTAKQRLATAAFHETIVDGLAGRDKDAAERAMADHLADAGEYWQRRYPHDVGRTLRWSD